MNQIIFSRPIETTYDSMDIPSVLYKYRTWNSDFHKDVLRKGQLYLSAPSDFEDKLDCKNRPRYDLLTESDIFQKLISISLRDNPSYGLDMSNHIRFAKHQLPKVFIRDPKHQAHVFEQSEKDFDERFGVLSLTADPLNEIMWEKYSAGMTGYCIGIAGSNLFDFVGGGGEVSYVKDLPIIMPTEATHTEHAKRVSFKEEKWSFEKEYRTHRFWPQKASRGDRTITLPKSIIKEVILGPFMSANHKQEIYDFIREEPLSILVRETQWNEESHTVTFV